jgi:hypothetical protein
MQIVDGYRVAMEQQFFFSIKVARSDQVRSVESFVVRVCVWGSMGRQHWFGSTGVLGMCGRLGTNSLIKCGRQRYASTQRWDFNEGYPSFIWMAFILTYKRPTFLLSVKTFPAFWPLINWRSCVRYGEGAIYRCCDFREKQSYKNLMAIVEVWRWKDAEGRTPKFKYGKMQKAERMRKHELGYSHCFVVFKSTV